MNPAFTISTAQRHATLRFEKDQRKAVSGSRSLQVAIVDEELPFPPTSGKRIRTLNLITRLAQRHHLFYVCHKNADAAEAQRATQHLHGLGIETIVVDRVVPPRSGPGFYGRLAL